MCVSFLLIQYYRLGIDMHKTEHLKGVIQGYKPLSEYYPGMDFMYPKMAKRNQFYHLQKKNLNGNPGWLSQLLLCVKMSSTVYYTFF